MNIVDLKKYIVEQDKIINILAALKCTNIKSYAREIRACLPNSSSKNNNIAVNKDTLSTKVFTNAETIRGDIVSLVMYINNVSFVDALKFVHATLGLAMSKFEPPKKDNEKVNILDIFNKVKSRKTNYSIEDLPPIDIHTVYDFEPYLVKSWFKEGITEKTKNVFGIGYSNYFQGVIIPHRYYLTNQICGIMRRTTNPLYKELGIAKYFPIKAYQKSLNLYGLSENYETIQESGQVWVYEAEKSVLKRYSRNDGRGVACMCHEISQEQVAILLSLNVEIVISFDSDIEMKHILATCEKFYMYRTVYFTYDFLKIMPEKSSIADLDNEMFKYFENNKVLYDNEWHDKYLKMLEEDKK